MKVMRKNHTVLYFFEFGLITAGFAFLLAVKLPLYTQSWVLALILIFYIILGIYHHGKDHDITTKVVLEYILVSALIFALFIFLNISRL